MLREFYKFFLSWHFFCINLIDILDLSQCLSLICRIFLRPIWQRRLLARTVKIWLLVLVVVYPLFRIWFLRGCEDLWRCRVPPSRPPGRTWGDPEGKEPTEYPHLQEQRQVSRRIAQSPYRVKIAYRISVRIIRMPQLWELFDFASFAPCDKPGHIRLYNGELIHT